MTEAKRIGFTGTRQGMTAAQLAAIAMFFSGKYFSEAHAGDCVGADAEFFNLAIANTRQMIGHPPNSTALRANLKYDLTCEPMPHLERNRAIVDACDLLIAAPAEPIETLRSGTWSTVRYARKVGRSLMLVLPSGEIQTTQSKRIERTLHCWEPGESDALGYSHGTCLLPLNHEGAHVFTPNEQIRITVTAEPCPKHP